MSKFRITDLWIHQQPSVAPQRAGHADNVLIIVVRLELNRWTVLVEIFGQGVTHRPMADGKKGFNYLFMIGLCTPVPDVSNTHLDQLPSSNTLSTPNTIINAVCINTLRPRQNERHFADDILKCIFLNENVSIAIKISLKFVPKGPINNIPPLVQIMARRRPGDKPLSEPIMVSLPTHICVTRP